MKGGPMQKNPRKLLWVLALVGTLGSCAYQGTDITKSFPEFANGSNPSAYTWRKKDAYKLLFVGNSFTYYHNLPELVQDMGGAAGLTIACESVTKGKQTMTMTADPTDEMGAQLLSTIKATSDYTDVILQEHSTQPVTNFAAYREGLLAVRKEIGDYERHASYHLYGTWGYPGLATTLKTDIPGAEMALRKAFIRMAPYVLGDVSPVGEAFTYCYLNHPEINLYYADQHHPSFEGSYLAALVHLITITHVDVDAISFLGDGTTDDQGTEQSIDVATAATLKAVAKTITAPYLETIES